MRRAIKFACALIILAVLLCACSSKPDNVSDGAYNLGVQAIEIADDYLNFKITSSDASEKIRDVYNRFSSIGDKESLDSVVSLYVSTLNLQFDSLSRNVGLYTDADITENRDNLAEFLGLKRISQKSEISNSADALQTDSPSINFAKEAIQITDDFLDDKIEVSEAIDQLYSLYSNNPDIVNYNSEEEAMCKAVISIKLYMESYSRNAFPDLSLESIIELRNEVADFAGLPSR